jgi:hypothetical protein
LCYGIKEKKKGGGLERNNQKQTDRTEHSSSSGEQHRGTDLRVCDEANEAPFTSTITEMSVDQQIPKT